MKDFNLILAGWLIDGAGTPVLKDMTLETNEGCVRSVRKTLAVDRKTKCFIDVSQCTLLPPLVDSHVHLFMSGSTEPDTRKRQCHASYAEARNMIRDHIAEHLAHGILALRDGGDYGGYTLRYKMESLGRGDLTLKLNAAGKAWHAPFRYGTLIGRTPMKGLTLAQSIRKTQEAVDHIKIVNSGLNSLSSLER